MSSWPITLYAVAAVLIAGIVRGYAGFGLSALCVASISLVMPMTSIVPVVLMLEVVASVFLIPSVWPHVRWRFVFGLTLSSVVAAPLGIYALQHLPAETVRVFVLGVILLACVLLARGYQLPGPQPTWRIGLVGFVAGAINGAGAVGGLIYSLFLAADGMPPVQFRASLALIFLLVDILSTGIMLYTGLLTPTHGTMLLILVAPLAIGVAVGTRLFNLSSPHLFRRFVVGLLIILALLGIASVVYETLT